MLSFLFKLANNFEREHGYRANVLYLNQGHFQCLKESLAEIKGLDALNKFMGMEIVLMTDAGQPNLAWSPIEWKTAVEV